MDHELLSALMHSRRSVRAYKADPVPEALLRELLEDAISAPSPSNQQPWRFIVVSAQPVIVEMASAVRRATEQIAASVHEESRESFTAYGDYFVRFEQAPVVIAAAHRGRAVLQRLASERLSALGLEQIVSMERDSGLAATAMAVQNLLLSAHARGLGASAMTGPLVAQRDLLQILGLPDGWGICALVPVGFPDESPPPTSRKDLSAVVRWVR